MAKSVATAAFSPILRAAQARAGSRETAPAQAGEEGIDDIALREAERQRKAAKKVKKAEKRPREAMAAAGLEA